MDGQNPYLNPYASAHPTASSSAAMSTSTHAMQYPVTMAQQDPNSLQYTPFAIQDASFEQPNYYPPMTPQELPDLHAEHHEEMGVQTEGHRAKERRKQQNRAAQAAFRERKKLTIKALEEKLAKLQKSCNDLAEENAEIKSEKDEMAGEIERLAEENQRLRTSLESSPSSEVSWWTATGDELAAGKQSGMPPPPPPGEPSRRPGN